MTITEINVRFLTNALRRLQIICDETEGKISDIITMIIRYSIHHKGQTCYCVVSFGWTRLSCHLQRTNNSTSVGNSRALSSFRFLATRWRQHTAFEIQFGKYSKIFHILEVYIFKYSCNFHNIIGIFITMNK